MVIERWGTVSVVPNHCSHIWSVFNNVLHIFSTFLFAIPTPGV